MASKLETLKKLFNFPFHPFLFVVFPALSLYAYNILEVLLISLVRPFIVSVLGTLAFLGILLLVFRNLYKAAILTSIFIAGFFSYSHLHGWLAGKIVESAEFGIGDSLFLFWIITFITVFFILLKTKRDLGRITSFLNVVSAVLVLAVLGSIIQHEFFTKGEVVRREDTGQISTSLLEAGVNSPDIYYLIFDRYAGQEVLSDFYNFDNKPFLDFLKGKGFYVASESTANYPMTLLSLTSSLNMDYLASIFEQLPSGSVETSAYPVLENSSVLKFLKSLSYKYYHVGSWYYPTRINPNATTNFNFMSLSYNTFNFDSFTFELYRQTMLPPIFRKLSQIGFGGVLLSITDVKSLPDNLSELHYNSAKYQINTLKEISSLDGPKFVFAHILLPHAPIVFGQNCERVGEGEVGIVIETYTNQLICTNRFIREIVETILSKSKNSIMILQSDEGANPPLKFSYEGLEGNYGYGFEGASAETLKERFNILNAIYLPGADASEVLYPTLTPVNTFRIVFNRFLGTNLPLLPDKNFVSWDNLWDLHEVTDTIRK